jgi:hypothetical protein
MRWSLLPVAAERLPPLHRSFPGIDLVPGHPVQESLQARCACRAQPTDLQVPGGQG